MPPVMPMNRPTRMPSHHFSKDRSQIMKASKFSKKSYLRRMNMGRFLGFKKNEN
jgi:hypothetical protein